MTAAKAKAPAEAEGQAVEPAPGGPEGGASTVRRSRSITKIAGALCAVQAEIGNPAKNKQNPHLRNWYADLVSVLAAVLPAFTKHRLCVMQLQCELDGEAALTTLLLHESGEWVETTAKLRPVKGDPQAVGSALSYARRYALMALAGVVGDDDDDGQAAARPAQPAQQPRQARPAARQTAEESQLSRLIRATEAKMVGEELCRHGELVAHLIAELGEPYGRNPGDWPEDAKAEVTEATQKFARRRRDQRPAAKAQLKALEEELLGRKLGWADAMKAANKPATLKPAELTEGEARAVSEWLGSLPESAA